MKAALEIWGAGRDLFQRGYAKETSEPAIVEATMAKPGVVLRRGVGSRGSFKEKAYVPDVSAWEKQKRFRQHDRGARDFEVSHVRKFLCRYWPEQLAARHRRSEKTIHDDRVKGAKTACGAGTSHTTKFRIKFGTRFLT
jgi:hypothetical protein